MRILIAEDDAVSRRALSAFLTKWGYEVFAAADGQEAWDELRSGDLPPLAVLDWMMPRMDGLEVCRRVREQTDQPIYIIMLTAMNERDDILQAVDSGVDDYVTKPFDSKELRVRVRVGLRIVSLQRQLTDSQVQLDAALGRVARLEGLLPICAKCGRTRDDHAYRHELARYITEHGGRDFRGGLCLDCTPARSGEDAAGDKSPAAL